MPLNWDLSPEDQALITKIVARASIIYDLAGVSFNRMNVEMDLTACHLNGCRLKLAELLNADRGNFTHDIAGIDHHINRRSGKLQNCFLPRYSA